MDKFESQVILHTVDNRNPRLAMTQRHLVNLPSMCPATGNPQPGSTLTVTYLPEGKLLELYSLTEYVHSFIGHPTVRDIEHFAQTLAQDCADALGVAVNVRTHFILNIDQIVKLRIKAMPRLS
jgi:NADPH-dependent 7-cyano-7-deazaguanine reductase QueF